MYARQLATASTRQFMQKAPRRNFGTTQQFQKDEQAAERDFINREERELLKSLSALQNKKIELDNTANIQSLSKLLVQHKVEPEPSLVADLMKWKIQ